MKNQQLIDHLFRHQFGKMVSILTQIFGLNHLELVEDAVQDTFIAALKTWKFKIPEDPEAWLTKAAKNRAIDLFRQMNKSKIREVKFSQESIEKEINDYFLDHEIADSQLRMIFTACHPDLQAQEQIAFALKSIAGFSMREIAGALLTKEESVKKRLSRARQRIKTQNIQFKFPEKNEIKSRLARVNEVIYLIFNEGFHSGRKDVLIRKELCGEALRLCRLILEKETLRNDDSYALLALMCFHSSRLDSRVNENNEFVNLENQDRTKWYKPLIDLGQRAFEKSNHSKKLSTYQIEAAIAMEHVTASEFKHTNWETISSLYYALNKIHPNKFNLLNLSISLLMENKIEESKKVLAGIEEKDLEQRAYLYHSTWAEYHMKNQEFYKAAESLDKAISLVKNESERKYLIKKKNDLFLN
ncbi:MAG: sigma-70 family RNA polymerase sigma factor [Bacteroidota bacterium]